MVVSFGESQADGGFLFTIERKAVCKDMTQSITQFDSGESKFYVNDTEVESEKFNSIAENYGLSEMLTVSCSDGVRVTNGQMDMIYNAYDKSDSEMTAKEI